jgi:hypothetical protein
MMIKTTQMTTKIIPAPGSFDEMLRLLVKTVLAIGMGPE